MGIDGKIERKKRWSRNKRSWRAVQRSNDPEDSLTGKRVAVRRKDVPKYIAAAVALAALGKTLW
jgi:hypothetical protein